MSVEDCSRGSLSSRQVHRDMRTTNNKRNIPCRNWTTQGSCRFGATCLFQHSAIAEAGSRASSRACPTPVPTSEDNRNQRERLNNSTTHEGGHRRSPHDPIKDTVCKYWKAGTCIYGETCRYYHATNESTSSSYGNSSAHMMGQSGLTVGNPLCSVQAEDVHHSQRSIRSGPLKKIACHFWKEGKCKHGEACKYSHVVEKNDEWSAQPVYGGDILDWRRNFKRGDKEWEFVARVEQEKEHGNTKTVHEDIQDLQGLMTQEAAVVEQYVASGTSLITCGAGMAIQHILTGFELCRITIKNLPSDATRDEISCLFNIQGVTFSDIFVLEVKPKGTETEAVVLAKADQGEQLVRKLKDTRLRGARLTFDVGENATWGGMGVSPNSVPFLSISWWAPSEVNLVQYGSEKKAREKVEQLNGEIWNNRRIRVSMNRRQENFSALANNASVIMVGCQPGSVSDRGFHKFIGSNVVETVKTFNHDLDKLLENIRQRVSLMEGVLMSTYEVTSDGTGVDGAVRVKVQFREWEQATMAYREIHKSPLSGRQKVGGQTFECWVPDQFQFSVKIPRQQYDVQTKQWNELLQKTPERQEHIHTKTTEYGTVIIKVVGKDKKGTGLLKVRIEEMIAGEKLDPAIYWHPSFASRLGRTVFEDLPQTMGVYARHDFKTRSLRLYADRDKMEAAKDFIKEQVDRLANMETTMTLDRDCVRSFMRVGLGRLKELLGDENVTVAIGASLCTVTVKGGAEASHHLQRILFDLQYNSVNGIETIVSGNTSVCPICYDDVSNPEILGCGHTYCSPCLRHFLISASDSNNFPIVCLGNEAQCKAPISIPSIRRFLPDNVFQNLVEAAFASYVERHPQELKYCTTPDCRQIYSRQLSKNRIQCPSCFALICSICDEEDHEGITCEERKLLRDPTEQERLNEELARIQGFKKCPQCRVFIEKTEGCNHMTCKCGAHVCWKCLKVFSQDRIYNHLRSAHGGIYDDIPTAMNNDDMNDDNFLAVQLQEIQRYERIRGYL